MTDRRQATAHFACGLLLLFWTSRAAAEKIPEAPGRAAIGWHLFFDPLLSGPRNTSCATCHQPEKGFAGGVPLARGAYGDVLPRHAPRLVNLADADSFFWDGRAATLEEQALVPLTHPLEMGLEETEIVSRVAGEAHYRKAFAAIGVTEIGVADVIGAITAFVRTLGTGKTDYDRWLEGEADALGPAEERGRMIFFTRGQCATCHSGPNYSDHGFHNIGTGTTDDPGRFAVTGSEQDRGAFKTPSLRNWRGSEPFMHDGRFATLDEVLDAYSQPPPVAVGVSELDPLELSAAEQDDLAAFLETLNGAEPDLSTHRQTWESLVGGPADEEPIAAWHDEVVVTASRGPRLADEVPVSVTVVGAEDLAASAAATLDDALRQVPGFSLFRRGGSRTAHPTTQGVSLRGIGPSGASRTLVLLDGVPVNDPFGGWIYWSRLPRSALERVEIVRGAASDLWGSAALGGVVQLLTRIPDRSSLELTAEAGSRGESQLGLAAGRGGQRLSWLADGRYFDSARYPVIGADQRGAIDVPAFSEHGALYGRLRYSPSPRSGFELRTNLAAEERGNGTPLTDNETRGGYLTAGFDFTAADGSSWRGSATAYDQRFENRFSAQAADRGSERPALDQFDVGSEAVKAGLLWTRPFGDRHRLTGGVEASRTDASTRERFFFAGTVEAGRFLRQRHAGGEEVLTGLFLQDEVAVGERLALTLSARLDRWRAFSGFRREVSLEDGSVTRDDAFADRSRSELSPRLGLRYRAGERWTVHGAAYHAFRAPTINELYRPFQVRNEITAANAELVPETIRGFEAGTAFRGPRLTASMTVFWNRLDDAVANLTVATGPGVIGPCGFVPPGGLCRRRSNLEEIRVRGLEAELTYRASGAWRLAASYLASDAKVRGSSVVPELAGRRLPQVPEHEWVLAADHTDLTRLGGRLQVRWVGEQYEDDANLLPLAGFLVVDLTLRRALPRGLELFAAVENLFDREVETGETADGLVSIGAPRLIHGGLRFRLP